MPTLPMYDTSADPDAWHRVTAPGGYEWWRLDAEDESAEVRVVVRLYDGHAFHPGYVRAYRRYLRRPTRRPPPVPRDYPCAELTIYRKGKVWGRFTDLYPAGTLTTSTERLCVAVGPNRLAADGEVLRLSMSAGSGGAGCELVFRPRGRCGPFEKVVFPRAYSNAEHRWVIARPTCDVEGTVACGGERLAFRGRGYQDHQYGTGPLAVGVGRWIQGRAILLGRALLFHTAWTPRAEAGGTHVIDLAEACRELERPRIGVAGGGRAKWGLSYPGEIRVADELKLVAPVLIDSSPFAVRAVYTACAAESDAEVGQAVCEIVYPGRLRWPVARKVVERGINVGEPVGGRGG